MIVVTYEARPRDPAGTLKIVYDFIAHGAGRVEFLERPSILPPIVRIAKTNGDNTFLAEQAPNPQRTAYYFPAANCLAL